jgi:hypothetical protein
MGVGKRERKKVDGIVGKSDKRWRDGGPSRSSSIEARENSAVGCVFGSGITRVNPVPATTGKSSIMFPGLICKQHDLLNIIKPLFMQCQRNLTFVLKLLCSLPTNLTLLRIWASIAGSNDYSG